MSSRADAFRQRVADDPANPLFRFSLGQALLAEGRPAEAVKHLRLAAGSKADWMAPRILLGRALLATGLKDEARTSLEDALRLAVAQGHEEPEAELRRLLALL
ncbi:MAG: tetratricopeptide repeat protein [Verrucomicrobia bacterium]|nr:tetratricopeptide repeat protein [Verrucomicrobiota bacterium]